MIAGAGGDPTLKNSFGSEFMGFDESALPDKLLPKQETRS